MAIKLDLEKTFEKIEWSLIRNIFNSINLLPKLTNIILFCLSSSEMAILMNGYPSESIKPSRGVRQGDPFSPYLFILEMEFLSLLIHYQISQHNWTPISISRHGPHISHTLFADDVFLFAEATISNTHSILSVLQDFSTHS